MEIIRYLSSLTGHYAYFILFTPASFHWSTLPLVTRMFGQGLFERMALGVFSISQLLGYSVEFWKKRTVEGSL
jgi:hypothetical protein